MQAASSRCSSTRSRLTSCRAEIERGGYCPAATSATLAGPVATRTLSSGTGQPGGARRSEGDDGRRSEKQEEEQEEVRDVRPTSVGERGPVTVQGGAAGITNVPASEDTPADTARELRPAGRRRAGSIWRRTAAGPGSWSIRSCAGVSAMGTPLVARYSDLEHFCRFYKMRKKQTFLHEI